MYFLEETRCVLGMVSEWLELDSEVEGIRLDSEIVCPGRSSVPKLVALTKECVRL